MDRLGRKNCLVAGIRSKTEYPTTAPILTNSGIGATEKEKMRKPATTRCWRSNRDHLRRTSVRSPSTGLKERCKAVTDGEPDSVDFSLRRAFPLLGRNLRGIGFHCDSFRVPIRDQGGFWFPSEEKTLSSWRAKSRLGSRPSQITGISGMVL